MGRGPLVGAAAQQGVIASSGGGGGALWSPIGQSWLVALYLADTGVLKADGNPATGGNAVATWEDQSGNGYHATEATDPDRPLLIANDTRGSSGVPSLGAYSYWGTRGITTPVIAFDASYMVAGFKNGTETAFDTYTRFWGGFTDAATILVQTNASTWRVSSADAWIHEARINGGALSTVALPMPLSVIHAVGGTTINEDIRLLNRPNAKGGDRHLEGPAFAFGFTDNTETADERDRFEAWLAHRAGIASGLVAGHPYKSAPPSV